MANLPARATHNDFVPVTPLVIPVGTDSPPAPPADCPPFMVYSNRLVVPAYAGPLYTIKRASDSATMAFSPVGGDAPSTAIAAFIGASTGHVSIWNDQSGNGYDGIDRTATWGAGTQNPIWVASEVNGHPSLLFTDTMTSRAMAALGVTFPAPEWTVFVVAKHYTYPNHGTLVLHWMGMNTAPGDSPPDFYVQGDIDIDIADVGLSLVFGADDAGFSNGNGARADHFAGLADSYGIIEVAWNNTYGDTVAKYNGVDDPLNHDSSYGTLGSITGDIAIGGNSASANGGNAFWFGWIAEIQVYNCLLSSGGRASVRNDIATYYNITL